MPNYDYECEDGHITEVTCSISNKPETITCPECTKTAKYIISGCMLNNPDICVLSYPGSKKFKAGYVHALGDKPATKTQVGHGGHVTAGVRRHFHEISDNVIPEGPRPRK
jgi:putative FmdB family regulatory protein